MLGSAGLPEILILVMVVVTGLMPLAIAAWALFMLHRIRAEQQTMQLTLDAIAARLDRS